MHEEGEILRLMVSPVFSAVLVNQMPASNKDTMHEYPNKCCIRISGLWMNRRGQIEESLMTTGEWWRKEVIVFGKPTNNCREGP